MSDGLQSRDLGGLVLRADTGEDLIDAQFVGDGLGHRLGVTGDHHHLHAGGVQRVDGVARFGPDLVGQPQRTDHLAVDDDVHHGGARGVPIGGAGQRIEAVLLEQVRSADLDGAAVDGRLHPDRRRGREVACRRQIGLVVVGGCDDRLRQGMLAVRFGRGSQGQDVVLGLACGDLDGGDGGFALGQRARLVEEDDVDVAHRLQRQPVLDQDAAAGGAFGGDRDDQGNRQAQSVRAGDDQHGDRADHRLIGSVQQQPDRRGDRGGAECEPEQQRGGPVGDPLGPGRGRLRVGDQLLDAGQRGVVAGGGDPDPQAGIGGDGAGHDMVADAAGDSARFAGDHRLVHAGRAVDDRAVGRDRSAGADDDDVVHLEIARGDGDGFVVDELLGLIGQQGGQRVESGGGLGQ